MKKFLYRFWKTIIWAFIIALILFAPGDRLTDKYNLKINHLDKIIHYLLFLVLEILILHDYNLKRKTLFYKEKILITLVILIYAALTELIQSLFITQREGTLIDYIADVFGIITGMLLYFLYKVRLQGNSNV